MRTIFLAALAVGAVVVPAAQGASTRDTFIRQHLSYTESGAVRDGYQNGQSVNFTVPATWTRLKQTSKKHLSFRSGRPGCTYSITWTTRIADDTDETPTEHVKAALPVPSRPYLIDEGDRSSTMAWRVTRIRTDDQRVALTAMQAVHRSLGSGGRAWQETIVSATSRKGDECHSGTYRNSLGPQIGDALATATGRIYLVKLTR